MKDHVYQTIFEGSPVGLALLGKNGDFIYGNSAIYELFNLSEEELSKTTIFDLIDSHHRADIKTVFNNIVAGNIDKTSIDAACSRPDKKINMWCHIGLSHQYDQEGDFRFILLSVRDITEMKAGERRLIQEKEEAEKLTRTKSDFLANMSHEIRTPIHTIMGMNDLLLDTELDAEQQEYAQQVSFSAEVLLSLINDILDFSKIEAGKMELEEIEFDIFETTEGAMDMVSLEAHKKGLEVTLFIEKDVPAFLIGDPVRLRQIIMNLFNNAVKFTSKGEIAVHVERVKEENGKVLLRLSVRDTGIGIPKEKAEKLFQAFTQADTSTTRKFGGTGLGLSISKNLSVMMGGRIGVESTYGEGSTFWFTVTMTPADGSRENFEIPEELPDSSILVVDDNTTSRTNQRNYLEEWGCTVTEAADGKEALEILLAQAGKGSPVDICLVDLLLPGMDGWQLASEINSDKRINSAKLVLLSPAGKSAGEAKMKLLRWFDAYLNKPLKKREFLDCLSRLVGSEVDLEAVDEDFDAVEELEPLAETAAAGGKVLVAEDHEVNQQLFETILRNIGWSVVLANNGLEAVKAVEKERFDIIFMDVQMPEMNGYEAARTIRESGINTPIIAATASAVKGELDRCYEVGMNDILVKPFKKKDVVPLLDKWIKKPEDESEEEPEAALLEEMRNEEEEGKYIFNIEEAVETFLGKRDVVKRVVNSFIEKVKAQLPVMDKALESGDFETLRGEAHSIKGGAWNLEIRKLGDTAKELEDAGREARKEDSFRFLEDLKLNFTEFIEYSSQVLQ